jgi:hypothetical protein
MVTINLKDHKGLLGCTSWMMMSDPKKGTNKNSITPSASGGDVAMWSTLFAFTFLLAFALNLAAVRLSL